MNPLLCTTRLCKPIVKLLACAFVALISATGAATAGDPPLQPSLQLASENQQDYSDRIDLAWGVSLTSNYISDGLTQSGEDPAVQGYGELSYDLFYSGVWLSTVDLDGDRAEIDFYAGIRPQLGPLALDIGYTRYFYDSSGQCCGVWTAKADLALGDAITLNWSADIDPQTSLATFAVGSTMQLAEKLAFSWTVHENLDDSSTDWNGGLKWSVTDTTSVDFRYHDSELYPSRYVLTLAYDFSTAE